MKCSFCGKETKKLCGLDLSGNAYCKRWLCTLKIWIDRNLEINIRIGKWRIRYK